MNQMLKQRIQNLMGDDPMPPMGMQAGGEVDAMPQMMAPNPDAELASAAINEFMMAADTAESPEEANIAKALAEKTATAAQAPMADLAAELAAQGRGGDSVLAHLTPGEVVLPAEMFDDPQFEATVESRFNELDLDPERYVVGMGIASLNANTGLEEFFLKKVGKFFKKVVKKVAPYAGIIAAPFTGGATAALIGGVGGLASGKGLKGALAGAAGGFGASKLLSGIGSLAGAAGTGASTGASTGGTFFGNLLSGAKKIGSGIGSLFTGAPGEGPADLSEIGYYDASQYQTGDSARNPLLAFLDDKLGLDPSGKGLIGSLTNIGGSDGGGLGLGGAGIAALLGKLAYDEAKNRRGVPLTPLTQMDAAGRYNIEAEIARRMGKERPSPVEFGLLPAGTLPQLSGGRPTPRREPLPITDRKPLPIMDLKPLPIMDRRVRDDDIRYTSGDRLNQVPQVKPAVMMNGGMVMPMRYAEGGNVAAEDFERMNGDINGPGTETSDEVPAMLSDGEFVMTGRAVRGAGAFDMAKGDGGIITLTPNKDEDRDRGTALMYDMMDLFSDFAGART